MRKRIVLSVLAVLLVGGACSPEEDVRPLPPGARIGGNLTVGIMSPRSIAPWLTSALDPYGALVVETMCDQVLGLDLATVELRPSIASDWQMQSAKQVTLKLREGLRYPDGTAVTTDDVQDSISRAARADVASPAAGVLAPVVGAKELGDLQSEETDARLRERLGGVISPDPGSIEVTLVENQPDAFRFLAHPIASIVSSKAFNRDPVALERKPDCVGPYMLEQPWQQGAPTIKLVRSPSYTNKDLAYTVAGRGLLDTIEFRIFPDRDAIYEAYRAGQVDVAFVPGSKLADARQHAAGDLVVAPTPTVEMIGLPTTRPPFDRPEVRIALSAAIDRKALVGSLPAPLHALGQFIPPTLGAPFDDPEKTACTGSANLAGDSALAQQMLERAGVDLRGTTLRLAFNDEFDNRLLVEAVARQWEAALGVKVELVAMPWEAMLDAVNSNAGLVDPFRMSWNPEVTDPTTYLAPLFHSASIQTNNWSRFTMRPFDYVLDERANKQVEPGDRHDEMLNAQNILCSAMPMIPVAQGGLAYLVRQQQVASAAGAFADRATGGLLLRELYRTAP